MRKQDNTNRAFGFLHPDWLWPIAVVVSILLASGCYLLALKVVKTYRNTLFYVRTLESSEEIFEKAKQAPIRDITLDTRSRIFVEKYPVYISLTTSPKRIEYVERILRVLDLTHVKEVIISIPKVFPRTGERYTIPQGLKAWDKIKIHTVAKDYGPATKLIPGVEYARKQHEDALVIALDDDHVYPRGIVNEHIYAISRGAKVSNVQDDRIGDLGHGYFKLPNKNPNLLDQWPDKNYHLIQGWSSTGYVASSVPTELIKSWLEAEEETPSGNSCLFSDDFTVSYALALKGVGLTKIVNRYASVDTILPLAYGLAPGALHREPIARTDNWDVNQMNIFTKKRIGSCFVFLLEHAQKSR